MYTTTELKAVQAAISHEVVTQLAAKYGFDVVEATQHLKLSSPPPPPLPPRFVATPRRSNRPPVCSPWETAAWHEVEGRWPLSKGPSSVDGEEFSAEKSEEGDNDGSCGHFGCEHCLRDGEPSSSYEAWLDDDAAEEEQGGMCNC